MYKLKRSIGYNTELTDLVYDATLKAFFSGASLRTFFIHLL